MVASLNDYKKPLNGTNQFFRLGEILVAEKLLSPKQLEEALVWQKKRKSHTFLGQILLDQKLVSKKQLHDILHANNKWIHLGSILKSRQLINESQINKALLYQKEKGCRLGEALVELNFLSEKDLKECLSSQLNIPFVNLDSVSLEPDLGNLITYQYAKKNLLAPIQKKDKNLTLAVDDPTNWEVFRELQAFTGYEIQVVMATKADVNAALEKVFQKQANNQIAPDSSIECYDEKTSQDYEQDKLDETSLNRGRVVVEHIIRLGIRNSATDIHIESEEREPVVRFRIDGILQQLPLDPVRDDFTRYYKETISRIKILARLDISEKRRPQDGSFRLQGGSSLSGAKIDFRVSIVPGYFGENVVIRILNSRNAPESFEALCFSERITQEFNKLLQKKTGIILITGATGSGKSTSLYGGLMALRKPGVKILTVEDPVEYVYSGLTQCQLNRKIGNTFAAYIRSFLRQDPDIIMVGEIRDSETAEMAFRAAQTGHLVLSTLHTNNAIDSISRLLSLNVAPHQIVSSLLGVLSQRLIRRICPDCAGPDTPSRESILMLFEEVPKDITWYKGKGCVKCNYTGYKGRIAVGELWTVSSEDKSSMNNKISIETIKNSSNNIITMMDDIYDKLINKVTTVQEIIRAIPDEHIRPYSKNSNVKSDRQQNMLPTRATEMNSTNGGALPPPLDVGTGIASACHSIKLDPDMPRLRLVRASADVKSTARKQAVYDAIRSSSKPITPKDIAARTGFRVQYVKNTLPRLLKEGGIKKAGEHGTYVFSGAKCDPAACSNDVCIGANSP